jgi:S1-C subfamily serine protease
MLLAPEFGVAPDAPMQPMMALPAAALQTGVTRVLEKAKQAAAPRDPAGERRAWVGFGASDLTEPEFLRQVDAPGAVVVDEVFEASPALAAGIAPHDVLLRWNDRPLHGVDDLAAALAAASPGSKVALEFLRDLHRRRVEVTLAAW